MMFRWRRVILAAAIALFVYSISVQSIAGVPVAVLAQAAQGAPPQSPPMASGEAGSVGRADAAKIARPGTVAHGLAPPLC